MLRIVNREDFKKIIKQNDVVVVKVTASWCGPCKKSAPVIEECINEINNIVCVHVDEKDDTRSFLKIKQYPTLIVFKGGYRMYVCESSKKEKIKIFFELVKELC